MTALQEVRETGAGRGRARPREAWVDNLRVLLIAGVVVMHAATGYVVDVAGWYDDDEVSASGVWSDLLSIPALFGGLFALGPLFVVAGWYAVGSLARRGPGGFARSRLVRLGLPLVLFVLVLQPATDTLGNRWQERGSFAHYLGTTESFALFDGVIAVGLSLWFVAWVRRRWPTHGPLVETAGRASYATYVVHPLVLTLVMMLLRPVEVVAELKWLLVGAVAVPVCFAVGHALTRTPGVRKVG